jgi:phage replication O-like protein O
MMENPQVENGHVKISNELYEAMLKIKLSDYEHRILGAIIRKTYGWNKKEDWISHSQLSELTLILPHHCARTITKLKNKKIIIKKDGFTAINKHYSQWGVPKQVLPIQVIPKQVLGGTQTGFEGVPKQVHTKDSITKDTYTKDKHPALFEIFEILTTKVKAYRPNHKPGNKERDLKIIDQLIRLDNRETNRLIELLTWYPIGGQYIPEIFSAQALRDKYDKLETAFQRTQKKEKSGYDAQATIQRMEEKERYEKELKEASKKLFGG